MADLDVFDFNLTDDELKAIDAININSRLRYDPITVIFLYCK